MIGKENKNVIFFCILIVIFFFLTDQYCYDSVYRKRANKITAGQKGSSSSSGRYRLFCNQYNKTFVYKLYNAIVLNSGCCLSSESVVVFATFFFLLAYYDTFYWVYISKIANNTKIYNITNMIWTLWTLWFATL